LEETAVHGDTWLLIERAKGTPQFPRVRVYRRVLQIPLLRALEVLLVMIWARTQGYRHFYVHYSVSAAILAALVTRTLGGTSYYWNCGHPLDFVPPRIRSWSDWMTRLRNVYLLGLTMRLVHHLVTGTESMARYYSEGYRLPRESVRVMPNWVDLKRFRALPRRETLRAELGWPKGANVVLFLHRLAERKGAHRIVPIAQEVLAQSLQGTLPTLFVVAGDGPYQEQLTLDVKHAGLDEHIRLVGAVPNREAIRYFAAADAYMMPSTEEGFPRVLLEAMAAGCPFVATDVGGVRDILTPAQAWGLVPQADWKAMANKLIQLLSDPTRHAELAQEGMIQVQRFSQEKVVQQFLDLLSAG